MKSKRSTTILVTGANGFIGRRMLTVCRARGVRAIGLGRTKPDVVFGSSSNSVNEWIVADVADDTPIVLPPGIDTVFHLAGKAHALADLGQKEEYYRANTEGTRRLLEAAQNANVRAFVFFSTVKAAGNDPAGDGPIDESWGAEPDTPYGSSKCAAERLVIEGGYVPHPVVLRPCLVYGPNPKGNLRNMITAVSRGRFPPLPEIGNKRSMVHIDDLIEAALRAAVDRKAAGQTYIVADNEPFSSRELYEWICTACDRPVPSWTVPLWTLRLLGRMGDTIGRLRRRRFIFDSDALEKLIGNAWYSSAKLQRELGWRPRHTLKDSLIEIVNTCTDRGLY